MPRLLQRPRPSGTARPAASTSTSSHVELPPYEEPAFPMNDAGKRALAEVCNTRETRRYEQHLSSSASLLRDSVGAINDALFNCQGRLAVQVEKRTAQGVTEKSEVEITLEKAAAELEAQVSELTERSEAALREVIDYRAELEDEKQVLQEVQQQVNAQEPRSEPKPKAPRRRRQRERERDSDDEENEDEDVEEDPEDVDMDDAEPEVHITGVGEILKTARESKADEYHAMSAYQRYGQNNDYISFKKTWHDAQHPDDQVPLPDAATWFDELGRPTKGIAAPDDDDDLVVEREIRDLKCPLSLQLMKDPYSNHKCKHTFEKSAIMDFLRSNQGVAQCPVCTQELRTIDLYPDAVMLRRVKRAEKEARRNMDTSDGEPSDSDDEEVNDSRPVEKSNGIKRENRRSLEDPEDVKD